MCYTLHRTDASLRARGGVDDGREKNRNISTSPVGPGDFVA